MLVQIRFLPVRKRIISASSLDVRAAQNRAAQVKDGLLTAAERHELEALKGQFSRNELTWVYRYLLTDGQRQSIKQVAKTEQLSLFTDS